MDRECTAYLSSIPQPGISGFIRCLLLPITLSGISECDNGHVCACACVHLWFQDLLMVICIKIWHLECWQNFRTLRSKSLQSSHNIDKEVRSTSPTTGSHTGALQPEKSKNHPWGEGRGICKEPNMPPEINGVQWRWGRERTKVYKEGLTQL